ncbi:right-handed parallel beta-helix repeat-containing protein [Tunicatimonas pelagia]|uniref:right-handed parallel beta-helix repeat-containing protein n=1 Tax=Tunicatimonas pelagia TaxID=931531 RepID=UPI003F5416A8
MLQPSEDHDTGTVLLGRDANRTIISDLSIRGDHARAKVGIQLDHCGDCQVEDVLVVGMQQHGIVLSDDSFLCEIRGAKVADSGVSGILLKELDRGGRGGDYVPNLVTNCIVYGGQKGIECDKALVANIVGCQVYQTEGYGFHLHNGSNSVLLSGCRTYQISNDAVVVESSHEINISSNIFCWHTGHGLVLRNALWGTITGNNIIDNGSINLANPQEDSLIVTGDRPFIKAPKEGQEISHYHGILIENESKGLTISSNAIFNWPVVPAMQYGIYEDSTCFSNLITANNINFCQEGDILSRGDSTQVIGNVSYVAEPHYSKASKKYQSFDTRLLDQFIEELKKF